MSEEIKAVVFDFDGVLVNSVELKDDAMLETFSEFGEDFSKEVLAYHKKFQTTRYTTAKYVQDTLNIEDEDFVQKYAKKYSDIVEEQIVSMPFYSGVESLLMYLCTRMPIYISTGTPEKEIAQILRKKCAMHLFSGVYGSPDTKETHFNKILLETNLPAQQVLFVGDMPSDYKVAQKVGTHFLGYNFYQHEMYPQVVNIDRILDVKDYIEKIEERRY